MLFMSADIEGSTAYKQQTTLTEHGHRLEPFFVFLKEFGDNMNKQRRKVAKATDCTEASMPREPDPWKILGDELIYVVELTNMNEAHFHMRAFKETLEACKAQENFPLPVKGSAWLAGFPVGNVLLPLDQEGSYDYLGASIDLGFRLSKFSTPYRICISADLAALLIGANGIPFEYGYEGRRDLKGILEKIGYPIIWINTGSSELYDLEKKTLGEKECNSKDLKSFCNSFITESKCPRFTPFVNANAVGEFPADFEEGRKATGTFLRRVFDISDEGENSEGKENGEASSDLQESLLARALAVEKETKPKAKKRDRKRTAS